MSREAVNQIIERAVADDGFFELLRNNPEQAIQGYELDVSELSAIRAGAYNVVVRGMRQDSADRAAIDARRADEASARRAEAALVGAPAPTAPKAPVAGLVGFFIGLIVIGGGIGGFRYFEHQWPWQAAGIGKAAAPAAIPPPSLGARPKASAAAAASPAAPARPSAQAKPSGQAQLRPSPTASASANPSASAAAGQQLEIERAYYQSVGTRLSNMVRDFAGTLGALRSGNDPGNNLTALGNDVNDLKQHLNDAPPPDQLKTQHGALLQAVPLMQGDVDQLKAAVDQQNNIQAILVAAEIDSLINQVPDEVQFATTPHPELYQAINSSQQLSHVLNFDVISQNVAARNNAPSAVTLRIGMQAASPTPDQVSDTLRHSIVAARQSYPQAGQVQVVGFAENNGSLGNQVGTATWYCSPDARPPDANPSASWQDACNKIYVSSGGGSSSAGNATVVPY